VTPTLPTQVITEMAQRSHRFHHYLWHKVRNSWLRLTESEMQAVRDINPRWIPPRPAVDAMRRPIRNNNSGEDFLFMHRQMIALVNSILTQISNPDYPRVEGWRRIPPPGDPEYPVPEFTGSGLEEIKSVEYFEQFISAWERRYADPNYLSSVTLGQLGSDIEFTIHNDMHTRWAAPSPVGYRPTTVLAQEINVQWDDPVYNYMGDTYASHVNPIFWKLHGWVDDRVEDWRQVNGIGEIEWNGNWVGPMSHHHNDEEHFHDTLLAANTETKSNVRDELQQIDRIISASAASEADGFFRPTPRSRP
jgi:hypothetical protein